MTIIEKLECKVHLWRGVLECEIINLDREANIKMISIIISIYNK